ncbi:type II toxin-antitoxin system RelE family toxin [Spirochaeta dissipatitropha]
MSYKKDYLTSALEGTLLLNKYKIAETETFNKKIKNRKYEFLYKKITDYVYPILRNNPYFGPNIKKLKGEYKDIYRYRIGNFRLFYKVSDEMVIVFIIDIEARKDSYK